MPCRAISGLRFATRQPAINTVLAALPATLELAFAAIIVSTADFPPARHRGGCQAQFKPIDTIATVIAVLGQSMPVFWLGILLILLFSVTLNWLPVSGRGSWQSLILPAVTLGWYMNALMTRLTRSAMVEVLNEPYIRTARAKGMPLRTIIFKHAFRNARIPILTIWGLQVGTMLTGTVVTETVFAWPGLGRASIHAVVGRDFPVVMASIALFTLIFVLINLIVDLAYYALDPRIRKV